MNRLLFLIYLLLTNLSAFSQGTISISQKGSDLEIGNSSSILRFNLEMGTFDVLNNKGDKLISNAFFQAEAWQSKDKGAKRTWSQKNIKDELGKGKLLMIRSEIADGFGIDWSVSMYEGESFYVFKMEVTNNTSEPKHLRMFYPLISHDIYNGRDLQSNYRVLDGNGGGESYTCYQLGYDRKF